MAITRNNQQSQRSTSNASSYTLSSYAVSSGSDRVLVVRVHAMRTIESDFTISSVVFNGSENLTAAITQTNSSTSRWYRTSIYYLIAPTQTTADIVVTLSTSMGGCIIEAETLLGAAQTSLIGQTDTDTIDNSSADTSYTLTGTGNGSLILAAVLSSCAGAPTWSWATATEDYDLAGSSDTAEVAGSGAHYASSGGNVTITATRSATVNAQVGVAAEFKPAASAQTLTAPTIAATTTLYAGAISSGATVLTAPTIAATTALYAGMVHQGTINIDSITIVNLAAGVDSYTTDVTFGSDPALLVAVSFTYLGSLSAGYLPVARLDGVELTADPTIIFSYLGRYFNIYSFPTVTTAGTKELSILFNASNLTAPEIVIVVLSGVDNRELALDANTTLDSEVYGTLFTNSMLIAVGLQRDSAADFTPISGSFVLVESSYDGLSTYILASPIMATAESATYGVTSSSGVQSALIGVVFPHITGDLTGPAWSTSTTLYPVNMTIGQQLQPPEWSTSTALYAGAMKMLLTAPTIAATTALYAGAMGLGLAGPLISSTALYAGTVTPGGVTLTAPTIAATVLYAGTMAPGGVTLTAPTIASTLAVYEGTATPGAITLGGRMIDIGTQVYAGQVTNYRYLESPFITATTAVYEGAVTVVQYLYSPLIGLEIPLAINAAAMIDIATLYAAVLSMTIYGATLTAGTVYAGAIATGSRVQAGQVYPATAIFNV